MATYDFGCWLGRTSVYTILVGMAASLLGVLVFLVTHPEYDHTKPMPLYWGIFAVTFVAISVMGLIGLLLAIFLTANGACGGGRK